MKRRMSATIVVSVAALVSIGCMKKARSDAPPTSSAVAMPAGALAVPIAVGSQHPEAQEPRLSFNVAVGSTRVRVVEGETAAVPGNFQNPAVSVTVEPQRTFTYAGLRFDYPRSFTFEADLDGGTSSWTLSGNDLKIMVFRFDERVSTEEYVQELVKRFGPTTTTAPMQLRLGNADYPGTRLDVRVVKTELVYEVVGLPQYEGKYRILAIQDNKKAANVPEGVNARALLARSFHVD